MGIYFVPGPRGGAWWIRYQVRGHRRRESCGPGSTKTAAKHLLARRIQEAREGRAIPATPHATVGAVVDAYLGHLEGLGRRDLAGLRRGGKRGRLAASHLWGMMASTLPTAAVEEYTRRAMAARPPAAPATINRGLALLRAALRWAVRRGDIAAAPHVRLLREPPGRVRYLSDGEEARILGACAPELRRIVIVALQTGMRLGELLALRWADIDAGGRMARIERSKSGRRRDVPLTDAALSAIGPPGDPAALVFPGRRGPRHPNTVSHGFALAVVAAGVRDCRFHDLRHTYASRLAMRGADLLTIRDLLGHATTAMAERYAHLMPGRLRVAVDSLPPPAAPVAPDLAGATTRPRQQRRKSQ